MIHNIDSDIELATNLNDEQLQYKCLICYEYPIHTMVCESVNHIHCKKCILSSFLNGNKNNLECIYCCNNVKLSTVPIIDT